MPQNIWTASPNGISMGKAKAFTPFGTWKLGKFRRKANRRIGGVYVTDHFMARFWSVTQSFTDPLGS